MSALDKAKAASAAAKQDAAAKQVVETVPTTTGPEAGQAPPEADEPSPAQIVCTTYDKLLGLRDQIDAVAMHNAGLHFKLAKSIRAILSPLLSLGVVESHIAAQLEDEQRKLDMPAKRCAKCGLLVGYDVEADAYPEVCPQCGHPTGEPVPESPEQQDDATGD